MSKHQYLGIRIPIEQNNPGIMRHEEKCIKCGQCLKVCSNEIAVASMYDLAKTGDIPICIHCGQCANICPADSITEQYELNAVRRAIADPDKIVIVSTSPSVRVAIGEEAGMEPGEYTEGKMVAALRELGFDYVLDTTFAADLTITEEASELIDRITNQRPLPQFTSCCPAWVKFAETFYPEILPHISTAKSPIGMQGPTIKTYFAKKRGLDSRKIVNVALTPCTAKKFEIRREEMRDAAEYLKTDGMADMDYVITTRELGRMIRDADIDFKHLPDSAYDDLLGRGSGAGIIFGNTGGVMEAALRTAYFYITKEAPPENFYSLQPVRGMEGIKEAAVTIGDTTLRAVVIYGTGNARDFIEKWKAGEIQADFVEVMTCPGGCIGGGGQPKSGDYGNNAVREQRIAGLYQKDAVIPLRLSHENPDIIQVYKEFYGQPLSELAEKMLHTVYISRKADLTAGCNPDGTYQDAGLAEEVQQAAQAQAESPGKYRFRCKVCGYIEESDGPELPANFQCPLCKKGREFFERI